ncbi:MAG TPA: MXAN_5187 C-terminal domain-containing protein [Thermoanaerobaculia bacterium]
MIKQDDELDKLEEDIRKLKNKYDQFFAGISKWQPTQERRNIEVFIHEFSKQKMRDNTRRFRFNTILSRFNQLREMWARKMREREEGPLDFRRRQAAFTAPAPAPPPPQDPTPAERRVTSSGADPYVKMAPGTNGEELRKLYSQLEQEHSKIGKAPNLSFDQLAAMIEKQSETIRSRYNVNTVAFRVETVDGKVKLKAKPLQD